MVSKYCSPRLVVRNQPSTHEENLQRFCEKSKSLRKTLRVWRKGSEARVALRGTLAGEEINAQRAKKTQVDDKERGVKDTLAAVDSVRQTEKQETPDWRLGVSQRRVRNRATG
jgi:hypothetical protein